MATKLRVRFYNEALQGNESESETREIYVEGYNSSNENELIENSTELSKEVKHFKYWSVEVLKTNVEWIQVFQNKTNSYPSKESVLSVTLNGTNTIGGTFPEISENEFIELLTDEDRRVYQFNTLGV